MVLRCDVKGCRRNSSSDLEHSFFRLPKDAETRLKWLKFIGVGNERSHLRICTDHFEPGSIRKKYPRPLLVRNAVPTIRKSPEQNPQTKVNKQNYADDDHSQAHSLEEPKRDKTSPARTQIINIHANNVSQIIISDGIPDIRESTPTLDETPIQHNSTPTRRRNDKPIITPKTIPDIRGNTPTIDETSIQHNSTPTRRRNDKPIITPKTIPDIRGNTPTIDETPIQHNSTPTRRQINKPIITPKTMRLNAQKRTIAALRSKINRLKLGKPKQAGLNGIEKLIEDSAMYLPTQAHTLLATQLRLAKRSKFRNRYDNTLKDIALSIFYHSPKAYKFLRKVLTLPSEKVLREYQRKFAIYPGINIAVLAQLKDKFEHALLKDKVVSLLFDEILLTSEVHFDPSLDQFVGLADDGSNREPVTAKTALVCMITWINKNVKQVLGHWLLPAKGTSNKTHNIILDAIGKVNDTGLIVKSIIFDQGPKNQGFLNKVNVSSTNPFFTMNGHNIYIIWDPPHLLKSIRNNLKDKTLFYKEGKVEWSHIKQIHVLSGQTNLNLIPKISDKHFQLNTYSKMRVSIAAQILSESMYTAYLVYTTMFPQKFCQESCDINCKCLEQDRTGQFILDIDKVFDSLNSSFLRPTVPNKLNYAMAEGTPHEAFLQDMATNLQNCKFKTGSRPPCLTGLVLTIHSTLLLARELRENYGISKLCTRRLNQDPLENLFAVVRQQHGCNVDPSPKQFEAGLRHIYITHLSKISNISNCETDENKIFAKLSQIPSISPPTPIENIALQIPIVDDICENVESEVDQFTKNNAIYYIAGYLCKKYLSHHTCEKCRILLLQNDDSFKDYKLFTILKQYADTNGLLHAKENVFLILKRWESQFKLTIDSVIHVRHVTKVLAGVISQICPLIELCSPEATHLFFNTFLKVRCHWHSRFIRRQLRSTKKSNQNSKLNRFTN